MLKELSRSKEEVKQLIEKTNREQAVLVSVKIEQSPDTDQWSHLEHLQHEYHFTDDDKLFIDSSVIYTEGIVVEEKKEDTLKYLEKDTERLNKFKRQQLWLDNYTAKATIRIPKTNNTIIKSKTVYGVDSDTCKEDIQIIKEELLSDLEYILDKLNVYKGE